MPSFVTEGLILKRREFGEADRVLAVLTDRYGKIPVIARGVRKISSRRAGNVELLNRVRIHIYKSKGYTLTEAESLHTFARLKNNLAKLTSAMHALELVDRLVPVGASNDGVYELTIEALSVLENHPRQIVVRAYEVKLLNILGFWDSRKLRLSDGRFDDWLEKLLDLGFEELVDLEIDETDAVAIERLLGYYIEEVLESKLKARQVLKTFQR